MTDTAVSVVIPAFNAGPHLPGLFRALAAQEPRPPDEIILVDSGSKDRTLELARAEPGVRVVPISDFTHGRSRNTGARAARGALVALLSQDALPADARWLARLAEPFADPAVAAVFSRQIPRPDANPMERYFLLSHFPPGEPRRMAAQSGQPLSFQKNVFFSNVSAAIRRDTLLRFPFDENLIMSEDQRFALDVLGAGHAIVYQPASVVLHSHNYTLGVCFRRYFDSVYSLTEIFATQSVGASVGLGLRYLFGEMAFMARRHPRWLPYYFLYTGAKAAGVLAAHGAPFMPPALRRRCSLHRYHWDAPAPGGGAKPREDAPAGRAMRD